LVAGELAGFGVWTYGDLMDEKGGLLGGAGEQDLGISVFSLDADGELCGVRQYLAFFFFTIFLLRR